MHDDINLKNFYQNKGKEEMLDKWNCKVANKLKYNYIFVEVRGLKMKSIR